MTLLLKNGRVWLNNQWVQTDVTIQDHRIVSLSPVESVAEDMHVLDMTDHIITPGLIDVHVHLREPGFSYKETISTGTQAAAHGGYTHICAMPNLNPVPDNLAHLGEVLACIEKDALIHVHPYGAITCGEKGQSLSDIEALAAHVIAFSDDGKGVQSEAMMAEAMQRIKSCDGLLAAHCENESMLHGGVIHNGAYARTNGFPGISSESEWSHLARDLKLLERTGCRYHMCHVSTRQSVALIRDAKARGLDITAETGPHYLVLCEDDLQDDGRFKMNPPLRSAADREALIEGLLDGTLDMIATDHAPHSTEEKSRGLLGSAMGVVGLECAFAVLYTYLVLTGKMTLEQLLDRMIQRPAQRFGLPSQLTVGGAADLAAFDLKAVYTIDPQHFLSKGKATPFAGHSVHGRCVLTVVNGRIVWQHPDLC